MNRRTVLGFGALLPPRLAWALPACWRRPDKPIRFILPVGAGSGVDTITRAAAPALGKALGQPVVIENQPGAGGIVGTSAMVKSAPDGITLSVVSNNHVIYPSVLKSLPFDPINDITPISVVGARRWCWWSIPKLPATNVKELVALLKAKPGATTTPRRATAPSCTWPARCSWTKPT
jgi:tripartite-type tricarboxylate transporter receptor subunit TctC